MQNDDNLQPFILEKLYGAPKTIKPTSVEAECEFSDLGYLCNKIINHLNDDIPDVLLFSCHSFNKLTSSLIPKICNIEPKKEFLAFSVIIHLV